MTETLQSTLPGAKPKTRAAHPIRSLVVSRILTGVVSVFIISIIVYAATLLPRVRVICDLASRYCSTSRRQSSAAVGMSSMFPTPWPAV